MTPFFRKMALTAHIVFSVGWLGAIVPYLALAIAGLTSRDISMARAAYLSMELIGWFVIAPLSLAALLSDLSSHSARRGDCSGIGGSSRNSC